MWKPTIHHKVPQPAGAQCADWYRKENPTPEDMLYALAHTKGDLDRAIALLRAWVAGCGDEKFSDIKDCAELVKDSGDFLSSMQT